MSSDNYYTLREDTDGLWRVYHGFMSNLEDGFPATSVASEGYATEAEALAFYRVQPSGWEERYYSEYGLLVEDSTEELKRLRFAYFQQWPEDLAEEWATDYRGEVLSGARLEAKSNPNAGLLAWAERYMAERGIEPTQPGDTLADRVARGEA
jgi:hypothetical protein